MRARPVLTLVLTLTACTVGVRKEKHNELQYDDDPPQRSAAPSPTISAGPAPSATPTGVDASGKVGKICTKIGCHDRYALTVVSKDDKPVPAGSYEISLAVDGKKLSCKVSVGKKDGGPSCDRGVSPAPVDESLPRSVLAALELDPTPSSLEVIVKRGSATLSKSTVTPQYKTMQPNGPGCSPTCKHGEDRVAF